MTAANSCAPQGATCSTRLYPNAVVKSLREKMKSFHPAETDEAIVVPSRLELKEELKAANLRDSAALTLSVLAALYDSTLAGFDIFGVVKETGVDDEGLAEFSQSYFGNFPLYCDKSYSLYRALGDRKSVEFPSLWTLLTSFFDAWKRVNRKNIKWNTKGEGIVKGGIIVFDKRGKPRYAYQEEMGVDLPVNDLLLALESMRREEDQQQ